MKTKHNKTRTPYPTRVIGEIVKLTPEGNEWVVVHIEGERHFLVPFEYADLKSWEHFDTLPVTAIAKASMLK